MAPNRGLKDRLCTTTGKESGIPMGESSALPLVEALLV
jgi:hypothetical protein